MVLRRGEIYWADLPHPYGRRPVMILTRTPSLSSMSSIVAASITGNIRNLDSEVVLGRAEGLRNRSVASCDNLLTVPIASLDSRPLGKLPETRFRELDKALRYALEIRY